MPDRARAHNQLAKAVHRRRVSQGRTADQKPASDFFRVSATWECDRKLYFGRIGKRIWTPFSPSTKEKMEKGDLMHDYIRGVLIPEYTPWHVRDWKPEDFLQVTYPVELGGEVFHIDLRGHPDGTLWKKGLKKPQALLEVKSTNTFSYKKINNLAFQDPTYWAFSYFVQANRYAHMHNHLHPDQKVPAICIIVYNVNGDEDDLTKLPWRDWWFKLDTDLFHEDLRRLASIERSIRDGQVPESCYTKPDWQCRGCFYHRHCWPEDWKKQQAKAKQPRRSRTCPAGSIAGTK